MATIDDFMKLDMRIGTVTKAEPFPEAKKPAIKVEVDLGDDLGVKQSSAQITKRYKPEDLVGRQVVCVVNFPPMRIAGYKSEVLVMGGMEGQDDVVLLAPDEEVTNGVKISCVVTAWRIQNLKQWFDITEERKHGREHKDY